MPKSLPGAVVAQYRTISGKRYGPYWFRVWFSDGRQRKAYVRPSDLAAVREACATYRQYRQDRTTTRLRHRAMIGDFDFLMRTLCRVDRLEEDAALSENDWARLDRITTQGIGR